MLKHGPTQLILYMAHRNSKSKLNFFSVMLIWFVLARKKYSLAYESLYTCFLAQEIEYILKTWILKNNRQTVLNALTDL